MGEWDFFFVQYMREERKIGVQKSSTTHSVNIHRSLTLVCGRQVKKIKFSLPHLDLAWKMLPNEYKQA